MLFGVIKQDGEEVLCCIDKIGERGFLLSDFFQRNLKELCIESNQVLKQPKTMEELVEEFDMRWVDDMALFFGGSPELSISLEKEKQWEPLVHIERIWSPLSGGSGEELLK